MQEFKQLIEASNKILVTSHISPDPDAVCSALLLSTTLVNNYPDKSVTVVFEEEPAQDLSFVAGYESVSFGNLVESIKNASSDLIIIVDANSFARCTRGNSDEIHQLISSSGAKTAIIDHHEPRDKDDADVYINQNSPACTQDVYEVCFNHLQLEKPEGYAQTAILGIVADTGRFKYDNPRHVDTFKVVDALLDTGASIEEAESNLSKYRAGSIKVVGELAKNVVIENGVTISYVSDEFVGNMDSFGVSAADIKMGTHIFNNEFVRSIEDSKWGFVVYPEIGSEPKLYSASFRSAKGVKDVSEITHKLGGGGHKSAAGAKIEASSVDEAVNIVKAAL